MRARSARAASGRNAYAGYVRDLDGNKLAAYCRNEE